jgi:hypothetical protein
MGPNRPAAPVLVAPPRRGAVPPWLRLAGLIVAGGLFIVTGALKVIDPKGFAKSIIGFHLVPEGLAPAIGVLMPWWEIVAGGLAIAGVMRRGALAVLAGLAGSFLVASSVTIARGLSPSCGCFGALGTRVGPATVLLDLGLLILTGALLWTERGGDATASGAAEEPGAAGRR